MDERERLDRVYRQWSGTSRLWMNRTWWEARDLQGSAFLLQVMCLVPAALADLVFWPIPWSLWEDARWEVFGSSFAVLLRQTLPGEAVLAMVLLLWLGNSVLVLRILVRKAEPPLPGGSLVLRSILAGVPLLPEFLLTRWRTDPSAVSASAPGPSLDILRPSRLRSLRGIYRSLYAWMRWFAEYSYVWALWLAAVNPLALILVAVWLGDPAPRRFGGAPALALMAGLHLIGFLGAWTAPPPDRAWPGRLFAFAWLLPNPVPLAAFALQAVRSVDEARGRTLVHAAWLPRRGVGQLPLWRGLRRRLRDEWRSVPWWSSLSRPLGLEDDHPGVRTEDLQTFRASRAKAGSLFADGLILGWGLTLLSLQGQGPASLAPALFRGLVLVSWTWLGAGLALAAVHVLAVVVRSQGKVRSLDRLLGYRFLLQGGFVLLVGLHAGMGLGQDEAAASGMLVVVAYCLAATCSGLVMITRMVLPLGGGDPRPGPEVFRGALGPFGMMLFGGALALGGSALSPRSLLPAACVPLFWGLLLAVGKGDWLLRPYGWRGLRSFDLPQRTRLILGFLALTLALPLGGLVVPVWPFARRRLAGGEA